MIYAIISELGPWTWWVAGLILLSLEIVLPGVFLMFFGISALVVGTIAIVAGPDAAWWPWQAQVVAFGVLALISAFLGRNIWASKNQPSDKPHLNDRGGALVGRLATLSEPIVDGAGRVKLGDTTWRVKGPDLPVGTKVKIASSESSVLSVVAVSE